MTRSTRFGIILGAGALAAFVLARTFPGATDRIYSRGIYPVLVTPIAWLTSRLPFSLAEIVFIVLGILIILAPYRGFRRARRGGTTVPRAVLAGGLRLAGTIGCVWAVFLFLWGLNYARSRPEALFGLPPRPPDGEVEELIRKVGTRLDELRRGLPEDQNGIVRTPAAWRDLDSSLAALQIRVLEEYGFPAIRVGRAKRFLLSPILLRWSVSGVYGPFTGEPNFVFPAAPGTLPFTLAHERAHLSGFAWEEDASFVALLTTWRSDDPVIRYSGWLELWLELHRPGRGRDPGVIRDLQAIARFYRQHERREAKALMSVYSTYLRIHGVVGGTASYHRVADMALHYLLKNGLPGEPGF